MRDGRCREAFILVSCRFERLILTKDSGPVKQKTLARCCDIKQSNLLEYFLIMVTIGCAGVNATAAGILLAIAASSTPRGLGAVAAGQVRLEVGYCGGAPNPSSGHLSRSFGFISVSERSSVSSTGGCTPSGSGTSASGEIMKRKLSNRTPAPAVQMEGNHVHDNHPRHRLPSVIGKPTRQGIRQKIVK